MIAHSFSIEPVYCEEHSEFEPHLVVNEVDIRHHRDMKSTAYPLHHGGMQQLFLNLVNYVGNRIPSDPTT